jgi:hypothetical protein
LIEGALIMNGRIARRIVIVAAALASIVRVQAAPTPITLGVPGRANADVSLAASGAFVAATWAAATTAGETDIYAAASRDGGRTFSAPIRVNSTPGDARLNAEQPPRLALRSRKDEAPEIAVIWTTKGSSGTTLRTASSLDGARTFSASRTVPGSDAPGNRGWESIAVGPGGRLFSAWLDHRNLGAAQQMNMAAEHHQEGGTGRSAAAAPAAEGAPTEQLSQLYFASLDATTARSVASGVCYCCKTAIAVGQGNTIYLAWRHVYADNLRDIAFTISRDGGATFAAPVRVSEDHWQINGCPEDGPAMAVDSRGTVHVIWPTVITENGGPVKALFHAMTRDGRTFTPRERIPTTGQANHPQLAVGPDDALMVVWEESGSGARRLRSATGRTDAGHVRFTDNSADGEIGRYPVVVPAGAGQWVRAWTAGDPATSQIHVARMP